uniref:Uncharacterized protein n=1 Tax=Borrelia hermsii TaxID=140 RepID=S4VMW9_BORHE|nr:hypothetical protein BHA002 [Borrelia hermsii]
MYFEKLKWYPLIVSKFIDDTHPYVIFIEALDVKLMRANEMKDEYIYMVLYIIESALFTIIWFI